MTSSTLTTLLTRPRSAFTDDEFLKVLYASTRDDLDVLGWPSAQHAAFCDAQWAVREAAYRSSYPFARDELVLLGAAPVGRLLVAEDADAVHVVDVALLPDARGRGLGSALLSGVQDAARARGLHVVLYVDCANPARRLYERLGFVVTDEHGLYLTMSWTP